MPGRKRGRCGEEGTGRSEKDTWEGWNPSLGGRQLQEVSVTG